MYYYETAQANCLPGMVAIGGGAQFVEIGTGITRDGALMSSLPVGGSPTTPPTGWLATGSTQFTSNNGAGVGDQLIAYAVCAAAGLNPSTVTIPTPLPPPPPFFLSTQVSCPSGLAALSGGVRLTDATSNPRDGMVMSTLPDYTGSNPPTGWLGSDSAQYTTIGGNGVGDHLEVQAVCADVCAAAAIEVVFAPSSAGMNTVLTSQVNCPSGKVAIGGGARFAHGSATADGALMRSMPVFTAGGPPTGWIAAGSTQYLSGGPDGPSDQIVAYAVCAIVSP
jgi:hypothetical protein